MVTVNAAKTHVGAEAKGHGHIKADGKASKVSLKNLIISQIKKYLIF